MLGAIIGDIVGSVYEFNNIKTKEFELFGRNCIFTDDTILTVALADTILHNKDYADVMREYYHIYPNASYGSYFRTWAKNPSIGPYGSFGNGAVMRISPVGFIFDSVEDVLANAKKYTEVTHNHPESIKGAQAVSMAILLARQKCSKEAIKDQISLRFGYDLNKSLDEIRPTYSFDVSTQGTVPVAIRAFLESRDFEDTIRNAISVGGDSDTIACVAGGIAEAYYGIPLEIIDKAVSYLPRHLMITIIAWYSTLSYKLIKQSWREYGLHTRTRRGFTDSSKTFERVL